MYLTSTLKRTLVIGGISLLAVVGLVGWTRDQGRPVAQTTPVTPNWYTSQSTASQGADPSAPVVYAPSPFGSEAVAAVPAPAYGANFARAADPEPVAARALAAPQRRYYRTSSGRRHVVVKKRPLKRSAAIVGGAAAGGALIGALAGGGKGAAIGALAGGGGGLVYDRMTYKKRVVR
jgi:hypothetical protein